MKNKKNMQQILFSSIAVIILLVAVIGISYAVWIRTYQGTKENSLTTDTISFSYVESETNNINITNAVPMSDYNGKNLKGADNTFDFTVYNEKLQSSIFYDVYATPYEKTLPEQYVKVYLTDQNNVPVTGYENEVPTYNTLKDHSDDTMSKILYSSELNKQNNSNNLRLRVWLSDNYNMPDESLKFAFKVNVKAKL